MEFLGIIIVVLIIGLVISCIKVVPQAQALVVERLGAYQATWSVGLHFKRRRLLQSMGLWFG